jgi:para-nitrobenzyl esterase
VIEADARAEGRRAKATWVYQVDFQSPVKPDRGAPHHDGHRAGVRDAGGRGFVQTGTAAEAQHGELVRRCRTAFAALARRPGRSQSCQGAAASGRAIRCLDKRATMVFDKTQPASSTTRGKWERELFARVPYIQPGT